MLSHPIPASQPSARIGVGIDTSRDGHRGDARGRTFSVHLEQNVFQCFDKACAKKGDVIDLWASVKGMSLRDAALDLVATFGLKPAPPGTGKRNG